MRHSNHANVAYTRHNRNDKQVTVVYEMRSGGRSEFQLSGKKERARKIEGQLNGKSDERWLICDRKRKIEREECISSYLSLLLGTHSQLGHALLYCIQLWSSHSLVSYNSPWLVSVSSDCDNCGVSWDCDLVWFYVWQVLLQLPNSPSSMTSFKQLILSISRCLLSTRLWRIWKLARWEMHPVQSHIGILICGLSEYPVPLATSAPFPGVSCVR